MSEGSLMDICASSPSRTYRSDLTRYSTDGVSWWQHDMRCWWERFSGELAPSKDVLFALFAIKGLAVTWDIFDASGLQDEA